MSHLCVKNYEQSVGQDLIGSASNKCGNGKINPQDLRKDTNCSINIGNLHQKHTIFSGTA